MPQKKQYLVFGLLLLTLWETYNTEKSTTFTVCMIVNFVWSLYLYITNTQPHTPISIKTTKTKPILVTKALSVLALIFGAICMNALFINAHARVLISFIMTDIVVLMIVSDIKPISIAIPIAKFAIISSIIIMTAMCVCRWLDTSLHFNNNPNYKVWTYPLAALLGWAYDKYFQKLNWINYILSVLAAVAVAMVFAMSMFSLQPAPGLYVLVLLPLPAYGLILFSRKMFRTHNTFKQNVELFKYDMSIKFSDEANREKLKIALLKTMKIIAGAIVFVLMAWWISTIDNTKTPTHMDNEPIITSNGDTIQIDDTPEPSRLKIEIKKENKLDARMNMIDVYTAIIKVDTTLQPEIHRIPNNVSNVIIYGCDEQNGVTLPKSVKNIRLVNCRSLKKVKYPSNITQNVTIEGGEMQRIRMPFTRKFTVKNCNDLQEIYSKESIQYKFSVHAYNCPKLDIAYLGDVEADTLLLVNCTAFNIEKSLNFYNAATTDRYSYNHNRTYHLCKHLIYDNYNSKTLKIGDVMLRDLTIRNSPEILEMSFGNTDDNYSSRNRGFDKITIDHCPNVTKYNTPPDCEFSFNGWKSAATARANAFFSGNYMYAKDNSGVKLIAINQKDGDLVIPAEIEGQQVNSVEFLDSTYNFKSVALPKDFTLDASICGDWLRDVESIKFDDYSRISSNRYNYRLKEILNNPDSLFFRKLRSLNKYNGGSTIFQNAKKLKSVTLSSKYNGYTEMEFYNCKSLSTVTIPEGVQTIANYTFLNTALKEITIPSSVVNIGKMAFGFADAKIEINDDYYKTVKSVTATMVPNFQINGNCSSAAAKYAADYGFVFNATDNTFTYEKISDTQCRIRTYNGSDNPSSVVIPNKIHGLQVVAIDSSTFRDTQPIEIVCLPKGIKVKEYGKMKTTYISNGIRYNIADGYAVPCKTAKRDIDIHTDNGKTTASTTSGYIIYSPLPPTIDGLPVKKDRMEYKSNDFVYVPDPDQKTCEIIACTATKSTVSIPSQLDGYTVTSLANGSFYAFNNDRSLFKEITIPPTVKHIDEEAFFLDYFYIRVIYVREHYDEAYEDDEFEEDDNETTNSNDNSRYDSSDDLTFVVAKNSYAEQFAIRHRRSIKYTQSK